MKKNVTGRVNARRNELIRYACTLINNKEVAEFTKACLMDAPESFYTAPASSTGNNHPEWANGDGGLVRHTYMVLTITELFFKANPQLKYSIPYIYSAAALHDTCKVAQHGGRTLPDHPYLSRGRFKKFAGMIKSFEYDMIMEIVEGHMGIWGKRKPEPYIGRLNPVELVHLADLVASQKWVVFPHGGICQ